MQEWRNALRLLRPTLLKAAGFSQFGTHIRTGHEMTMLQDWADVIAKV